MKTSKAKKVSRGPSVVGIRVILKIPMSRADVMDHGEKLALDLVRNLPITLGGVPVEVALV